MSPRRSSASGNIGTAVDTENDHGPVGASALTRFSYSRRALRWAEDRRGCLGRRRAAGSERRAVRRGPLALGCAGARVAGGEVHLRERAVVDAQRHLLAVQDVEHIEDVSSAAYEAEHLGDVDGVARPGVGEQSRNVGRWSGWRRLEVSWSSSKATRSYDPGLVQDEVLQGGGLLVGRDPLVDQARHRGLLRTRSDPICRQTLSGSDGNRASANPGLHGFIGRLSSPVVKRSF